MESLMSRVEVLSKDGAGLQRGGDIKKMLLSMDKVASRAQTGQKLDWTETGRKLSRTRVVHLIVVLQNTIGDGAGLQRGGGIRFLVSGQERSVSKRVKVYNYFECNNRGHDKT